MRRGGLKIDDYSVCQLWMLEVRPGLDPRVWEGVNSTEFISPCTLCAKSVFSYE